ncbi:MAG: tRNA (adenosine(37)-N6)-dimethylallyltransferase MiaA [Bacteroidales bacterium]|jgi:tRNA dimethylallyltransferase|nr:tRNA (adenosine(37)-N6)-dimethylallyltransferase MiaA [Bacteroidales bacterium]
MRILKSDNGRENNILIVIAGATAVGKTALSIELAKTLQTEILSADARQFYKETVIGTATPSMDERQGVIHHFIGHLSIFDYYNVAMYEEEALKLLNELFKKNQYLILTGGSGLYIDAICSGIDALPDIDIHLRENLKERLDAEGLPSLLKELQSLDEAYYHVVDKQNPKRVLRALEVCLQTGQTYTSLRTQPAKQRHFDIVKICLTLARDTLNQQINLRTDEMLKNGFLEEAKALFPYRDLNSLNTVGYKELFAYFDGKYSLPTCIEKIKTHTRRYAKRQMTWFRKNNEYLYFEPSQYDDIINFITNRNKEGFFLQKNISC